RSGGGPGPVGLTPAPVPEVRPTAAGNRPAPRAGRSGEFAAGRLAGVSAAAEADVVAGTEFGP
ncbi:MAG: hypothetical protein JWN65_3851, partial [Solirubrobacterales bacterium]|nr:hypothetical protein [Solirubrobacterales bacterium]